MSPFPGLACLVSLLARPARCGPAAPPWSSPSRFAVVGLVDTGTLDAAAPGLAVRAGDASKHPEPLLVQDQPWEPRLDNGYPNVAHSEGDALGPWRLWYGGCTLADSCSRQLLYYANSSDGYRWEKPSLGVFNASTEFPGLAHVGTANNIVMGGGGIGVYHDPAPRGGATGDRFKAFGAWGSLMDLKGTRVSGDGIHWGEAEPVSFPRSPDGHQAYDTHNNLVWDPREGRYLMTTRWDLDDPKTGKWYRNIGLFRSQGASFGAWPGAVDPVINGSKAHQLYSQVTFPFYNIYLGLLMVFDTADPRKVGTVECRLAWSPSAHGPWSVVGGFESGPEAIPRGPPGSFDSHIVFAAAHPVPVPAEGGRVRLYYMGGDGPHNGPRNSSLGLATLRPDGFLALGGTGALTASAPVLCTGPRLTVTADIVAPGGSVRIAVIATGDGAPGADATAAYSEPLLSNATDAEVVWPGSGDLGHLRGKYIKLRFELSGALVYTVGFEQYQQAWI